MGNSAILSLCASQDWVEASIVHSSDGKEDLSNMEPLKEEIRKITKDNKVVIFTKSWCPFCAEASIILSDAGTKDVKVIEADHRKDETSFMAALKETTTQGAVPQIFIGGELLKGEKNDGYDDLVAAKEKGELKSLLEKAQALDTEPDLPGSSYDFDLFVIGGGSGGCAAALEAARNKSKKIAVADFVKPSPAGTTWGVGGTCVNVGCIPKKLMHIASTKAEDSHDLSSFGFTQASDGGDVKLKHDWDKMCTGIRDYIKGSLNDGMLEGFKANDIAYFNAYATLKDRHTVELDDGKGGKETKTAKYIMLAAGGRPSYGGYPGAEELCISSDDLFWLKDPPGKTLVVGAAYIALECAGFLNGLGYETTVMVRSMLLRGFDRECVDKIDAYMEKGGVKFIRGCVPDKFEKGTERKVKVTWKENGVEKTQEYDTVLLAVGRTGEATKLGLENAGVWFSKSNGKVEAPAEQTNVPNIFCIGDLVNDRPELTPVAKVAGKKVVHRLFDGDKKAMDYRLIATTVFTPLEYGMCGLTEEQCKSKFGDDGFTKITKSAKPLEWAVVKHREPDAFFKCLTDNKTGKIVGFHILGPNAGEIIQAFALAMKMGVKKDQLDELVGIHPTTAETMTMLSGKKIEGVVCES
eukprot:TRINITY_DN106453_c0_g1_i1.p1 TRINITY_DN106453_c0_g1~~TRINITY_DN106453_c0_g1_i1.p1  ORF type:complete len:637 (+),score=179.64 TRINITY_DN106453_c0_g1_i1:29-1939(+)